MTSTETTATSASDKHAGAARARRQLAGRSLLEKHGLVVLLVGVWIAFAVAWDYPATFRSSANTQQVLSSQAVPAILALASILPLVCAQFDLTVGSVAGMSAVTVAGSMTDHHSSLASGVAIALTIGLIIGLVNGVLIAYLGVNSLIATLGVGIALNGLVERYVNGRSILIDSTDLLVTASNKVWFGLPVLACFVVGLAIVLYYVLEHTPVGRYLQSVGSNATAAHLVGINVRRLTLLAFVASALISAVAGVLLLGATGSASSSSGGIPLTMPALVAVFLGATTIRPGRFNVVGTLVAVYLLAFLLSGLSLNGVSNWVQDFVTGSGLVLAVTTSTMAARGRRSGA